MRRLSPRRCSTSWGLRRHWAVEGLPDADRFATVASLFRLNQAVEAEFDRTLRPFEVNRSMYLVQFADGATTFLFPDEVAIE